MATGAEFERARRALRRQIHRNRRRIDGRIHAVGRGTLRLAWQSAWSWLWKELKEVWKESAPQRTSDK